MTIVRVLILVAAAAFTLAGPVRETLGSVRSARTALALVDEALELCRGADRNPMPEPESLDAAARSAAGAEALLVATEIGGGIADRVLRQSILGITGALAADCGSSRPGSQGGVEESGGGPGSARGEEVAAFVSRLNAAALQAVEKHPSFAAGGSGDGSGPGLGSTGAPRPDERGSSATMIGTDTEVEASGASASDATAGDGEVVRETTLRLEMGPSEAYRRRVADWSRVFRREAAALGAARRALQIEIDSYSLIEARRSCREFGRLLDRLDSDFGHDAPNRELSVRIGRMLDRYRRGVADCVAGKPAASYGFLSEGDREWSALARAAAPVLALRSSRAAGEANDR